MTTGSEAVVFDYDDTLVPDSTTSLLASRGIDAEKFWKNLVPPLVSDGYDPPLAYLRLILDLVGRDMPVRCLHRGILGGLLLREGRKLGTECEICVAELRRLDELSRG